MRHRGVRPDRSGRHRTAVLPRGRPARPGRVVPQVFDDPSEPHEAILARGIRNRRIGTGIEVSLPYGDYYLIEALLRVLKPQETSRAIGP